MLCGIYQYHLSPLAVQAPWGQVPCLFSLLCCPQGVAPNIGWVPNKRLPNESTSDFKAQALTTTQFSEVDASK